MDQLASVLLNVNPGNANPALLAVDPDIQMAVFTEWNIKLGNLIRLGKVWIKIIFTVLFADRVDGAV